MVAAGSARATSASANACTSCAWSTATAPEQAGAGAAWRDGFVGGPLPPRLE